MLLVPTLAVVSPASDRSLLTITELRSAVGLKNNSRDSDLLRLGGRVADALVKACKVAADGAVPPTLRQETVTDTFRLNRWWGRTERQPIGELLHLSRRPITSVTSVVEAGTTLDAASYEIKSGRGELLRLVSDAPTQWVRGKIVVTYVAGWETVPEGLKRAAEKLMRFYWSEANRDPLVKQINIPNIQDTVYFYGSPSDPSIPQDVMDDLGDYINPLT